MFTFNHFIWLMVCTAGIISLLLFAKKTKMSQRTATYIMAAISIASETSKISTHLITTPNGGTVLEPTALPFHLCSLMLFVIFALCVSHNEGFRQKLLSFLVPMGLMGGIAAMLIPTDGVSFTDILAYQCFVYHAGLVWYALYHIVTNQVSLGKNAYIRNIVAMIGLTWMNLCINSILSVYETNFMFLSRPPMENLPILNTNHGWGLYFFTLVFLVFTLLTLFHLPFILVEQKTMLLKKD